LQPRFHKGWKTYSLSIADQQCHIDMSENFLATACPGEPGILYWSQARPEGVVLGFSQKDSVLNIAEVTDLRLPIYHRRAGGTAVLVGEHLLSLDVLLPAGHPLILADVVESYRWLGETWARALQTLGISTRAVSADEAHTTRALLQQPETQAGETLLRRACYGSLSPYEVVVEPGLRKVVGLDMIRRRNGTLLQAGVLLSWDTEKLSRMLGHTPDEQAILREGLKERAVGLDILLGHSISAETLIEAFESVLPSFD
jgi:lipoate-protein ligase A